MAKADYKLKSLLTSQAVKSNPKMTTFVVEEDKTPEIYNSILTDEYILPTAYLIILKANDESYSARLGDGINVWSESVPMGGGSGSGGNLPVGTNRDLYTWDEEGNPIAGVLTPDHISDFPDGAPTSGQWLAGAQFDTEEQPTMGFVQVSTLETPIVDSEGMIPFYSQGGQLRVGTPQFPENAVPLILLDARVPSPPTTGTYVLTSTNGVVSWVVKA